MLILQSLQKLGRNLKQSSESKDKEYVDLILEKTVSDHIKLQVKILKLLKKPEKAKGQNKRDNIKSIQTKTG